MRHPQLFFVALVLAAGCAGTPREPIAAEPTADAPQPSRAASAHVEAPAPPADRDLDGRVTLERAIDIALAGSPDLRAALARVRQAEARRREVAAVFLPSLGADTAYVRADAPSLYLFKRIDAGELPAGVDFNDPGSFSSFESGFSARYNVFNGGRDALRRDIAADGETISRLDRDAVRNVLVASVIGAFYDVAIAAELVVTATASVDTVGAALREAEVAYDVGRVLKSDVLSLRVRLEEAREAQILGENRREAALAMLASVLGLDADRRLDLAFEDTEEPPMPSSYDEALAEALARRPELERARLRVEQAHREVSAARAEFLPSVDADARAYWVDRDLQYSSGRTDWFVGVSVSWSLFEGGRRRAAVARSLSALEELEHADRKEVLGVQLDVKTAYLALEAARARVDVTAAGVAEAEETLSLVRSQYEGGAATVTRYLESELALTRARMRRTSARFDLRKAIAGVARSLGRFAGDDGG